MTLMMCSCFEVTCKLGHHIYLTPGPVILTPGLDRFSQDGTYDLTEDKVPLQVANRFHTYSVASVPFGGQKRRVPTHLVHMQVTVKI